MVKNVSLLDRGIRALVSVVVLYVALEGSFVSGSFVVALLVGFAALNIFSVITAICPVYTMAQISTIRPGSESKSE